MRLAEIQKKLNKRIPNRWSEDWDNTGLLIGDPDSRITKIAVSLDFTEDAIAQAIEQKCQLLITHHPAIFYPLKSIVFYKPTQRAIMLAIKNNMAVYSAHTNWDSSPEGVNFSLAQKLDLKSLEPLLPAELKNGAWGLGVLGELNKEMNIVDFLKLIKEKWNLSACTAYGNLDRSVKKIAIGGGSCGDLWEHAWEANADVFVTSDVSYNLRIDILNMGLSLILTDHGETEKVSLESLADVVKQETTLPVVILNEKTINQITI